MMNENSGLFMSEDQMEDLEEEQSSEVEVEKYLVFILDKLLLGVNAKQVVEIIPDTNITHLPMLPEYVSGLVNLRGAIVPILDTRVRLGKMPVENSLIIVLNVDETQIGILVDTVDQMADIKKGDIVPMPANSSVKMISGMCSLPDGGTMMELDCQLLLEV